MKPFRVAVVFASLTFFGCEGGCRGNSSTPFDPAVGFEPLEPVTDVSYPPPATSDPYPEALQTTQGSIPAYDWAHGAAYVHAPIADVYAALQDPTVDRIHGTDWVVNGATEAGFPITFAIDYSAGPTLLQVHWTIAYRGGVAAGTADAPQEVGMRFQKISGTNYIPIQTGSVDVFDAGDGVSELLFAWHLSAYGEGPDAASGGISDWFNGIVAKVHGQPLP